MSNTLAIEIQEAIGAAVAFDCSPRAGLAGRETSQAVAVAVESSTWAGASAGAREELEGRLATDADEGIRPVRARGGAVSTGTTRSVSASRAGQDASHSGGTVGVIPGGITAITSGGVRAHQAVGNTRQALGTVEGQVSSRGAGAGVSVGVVGEARGAAEALGGNVDAGSAGRTAGLAEEGTCTLA